MNTKFEELTRKNQFYGMSMKETQEPKPAAESGTSEADCSALLAALLWAYSETCRHIEELERTQAVSKHEVYTYEAKKRADLLIGRILALMPNARLHRTSEGASASHCSQARCECRDPRTVWNGTRNQWICDDCGKPANDQV